VTSVFAAAAPTASNVFSAPHLDSASREVSSLRMSSWVSMKDGNRGSRGRSLEYAELRVKTVNQLMHQGPVSDGRITVSKGVSELLQSMTIVMCRHVALNEIVQFTLKVNDTTGFVSCEEMAKMLPDAACSGATKREAHIQ
jgi:hypothetical protein